MKPLLLLCLLLFTAVLQAQNRYDIVINEIMADPSPPVGLPANEWIELRNNSNVPVNLQGWRLVDASGQSGPFPNFILAPDSLVIVCSSNSAAAMAAFGTAISISSFPSLDNEDEAIYIKAPDERVIHAVGYSSAWYQNDLKKEGGWTLEMIDNRQPCIGKNNWKASTDTRGGTPGIINSVNAAITDTLAPELKKAFIKDSTTLILVFNEPLDSASSVVLANYAADGSLSFTKATPLPPFFDQVELKTASYLVPGIIYNLAVAQVKDCAGNPVMAYNNARVGLAVEARPGDCVINEILFNPRSNAYDYVELYNRSTKILDASRLYLANRNSSQVVSSPIRINATPYYFFPGDYLVVTENANNLALNYLVKNPEVVLTPASLPSFPDDKGAVILLNQQGEITDEVKYADTWHFKLIENTEGVALERVDPDLESQNENNWHSAASTAGFGTPGYQNSQYKNQLSPVSASIEVSPRVFSPDNDGFDDITTIRYKMNDPGFMANIIIFDEAGRPVRNLVRNSTLSVSGYWNWDGLDDHGSRLPMGTYIVFTEVFNLQGKQGRFKNVVVLAGKLN